MLKATETGKLCAAETSWVHLEVSKWNCWEEVHSNHFVGYAFILVPVCCLLYFNLNLAFYFFKTTPTDFGWLIINFMLWELVFLTPFFHIFFWQFWSLGIKWRLEELSLIQSCSSVTRVKQNLPYCFSTTSKRLFSLWMQCFDYFHKSKCSSVRMT